MAINPLTQAGAKPKGKRPTFYKDWDVERVQAITMAVAMELAVMRERLDTIERLLDSKGVVRREDIERFEPTRAQADERGALTQEYLARILRVVQQEAEGITAGREASSEDIAEELARV